MGLPLLVDPRWALAHQKSLTFVEVASWRTPDDSPELTAPTIEGAHTAGVRHQFAGLPTPSSGHLPLPEPSAVRELAAGWSGDNPRKIVVFTRRAEDITSATRAWFTLTWAGVSDVGILHGGLPAWLALGGTVGPRKPSIPAGDAHAAATDSVPEFSALRPRVLDADTAWDVASSGTLLDTRPGHVYDGTREDVRTGHIPGARSAPADELITSDGSLPPPSQLRRWFLAHGAIGRHRVAAYCNGGVASSLLVFAGALLEQRVDLYVDSWSGWITDQNRPVEYGTARRDSSSADFTCLP